MTKTPTGQNISEESVCTVHKRLKEHNYYTTEYIYDLFYLGDYDIRVEQAEFSEISVVASGEAGATVSIVSYRTGSKVMQSLGDDPYLQQNSFQFCSCS